MRATTWGTVQLPAAMLEQRCQLAAQKESTQARSVLEGEKQDKVPDLFGCRIRQIQLRLRPGIRGSEVESEAVDAAVFGALHIVEPLLRLLVTCQADLDEPVSQCSALPVMVSRTGVLAWHGWESWTSL